MDPQTISIAEVISQIRSATDQTAPFLLKVVVSQGRNQGKIRILAKCLKGTRPVEKKPGMEGSNQGKFLYKEHDTIPILDLEDDHSFKTIPISHIIGYNQYRVQH